MASVITAPSCAIRCASQAGTRPVCRGRSALPARRAMETPIKGTGACLYHALTASVIPRREPLSLVVCAIEGSNVTLYGGLQDVFCACRDDPIKKVAIHRIELERIERGHNGLCAAG